MASITEAQLRESVKEILKDADLSALSTKRVREQLEQKYDVDLSDRKKEIDDIVMSNLDSEEDTRKRAANGTSESEEEEEDLNPRKRGAAAKAAPVKAPAKRKGESGYTKKCKLSPELASVVGSNEMARHDVVKRMWQIVKERNLLDPKNKQFAICDDQLMKVIGTKRFRTFGMMKYLKHHISDLK